MHHPQAPVERNLIRKIPEDPVFQLLLTKSQIIERFATMDVVTELLKNDVLLGRSPPVYRNQGNQRFRALVESFRPAYEDAPPPGKHEIVQRVLNKWKERDPRGRFLSIVESDLSIYIEEDDKVARKTIAESTSHSLCKGVTNPAG
jgi:hypothetical protein